MRHTFGYLAMAVTALLIVTPTPVTAAHSSAAATRPQSLYVTGLVSDDVSIFGVRPDGSLAPYPRHVPTGGGSRGIVLAPDGRTAYVAVGFDPNTEKDANKVVTYRVGADGGLTPIAPTVAANNDPVALAITPDGRRLYLTNRGSNTVSAFSVAADGRLAKLADPVDSGSVQPLGLAVTPDGRFLYVSHRGEDETDADVVTRFAIRGDGTLAPLDGPAQIGNSGGAMAITPDGRFLFVPSSDPGQVFGFRIGADGALQPVPGSPYPAPDLPISAAVTPDGRHLYVTDGGLLDSGSRLVSAFEIGAGGTLRAIGDFRAGKSPVALTSTPDGRQLYVSNIDTDDVTAFDIAATGALAEIPGSPFKLAGGEQPALEAIAVSPNQGPVAAFTTNPAPVGQPSRFDASAAADPDGRVARFDWDFGDGSRLPDGGPTPAHTFRTAGTFTVTLTVTDDEGCSTRIVYTGTSALCNGSLLARTSRPVSVAAPTFLRSFR